MRLRQPIFAILALVAAALCASPGCDSSGSDGSAASPSLGTDFGGVPRGAADASVSDAQCPGLLAPATAFGSSCPYVEDAGTQPCVGLGCSVDRNCDTGGGTTVSGTVYDPAGRNPLPNVFVYIPSDPLGGLPSIPSGTPACGTCTSPFTMFANGDIPIPPSITDTDGHFVISDAPSGTRIPIVFQLGMWRREVFLPEVKACTETVVPADASRLPRNQAEGDIPQMALLAGGCDKLACFMRHLGLDASEFTGPEGGGRLHVYRGAGPGPDLPDGGAGDCTGDAGACPLWSTQEQLEKYYLVLLGCECGANNQTKPDMAPLHDWLAGGGRVFAIHSQRTWFENGPDDFRGVATWTDGASFRPFQANTDRISTQLFHDWLVETNALDPDGGIPLDPAQVSTSVSTVASTGIPWIVGDTRSLDWDGSAPSSDVKAFSFGTPIGALPATPSLGGPTSSLGSSYCGWATFSDVHPGGADVLDTTTIPTSCQGGDMTAEEKALEYLFFNLADCLLAPLLNTLPLPPPPPPSSP